MRIDKPLCGFSNCEFCFDGNCTSEIEYERCEYNLFIKNYNTNPESKKELLEKLEQIIYSYDELCSLWFKGSNPNDYAEKMDDLRNRALTLIDKLEDKIK